MQKMENYEFILEANHGVKGFEVLFQEKIEDCLSANGFKGMCWWVVLNKERNALWDTKIMSDFGGVKTYSIFWYLSKLYKKSDSDILGNIVEYYENLSKFVELRIEKLIAEEV